jgi:hypothetical protein
MEAIERLLTPKEYADMRRCSVRTTERERERGDGCPYVQIGRRIYYRREDIERFITARVRGYDKAFPPALQAEQIHDCTRDDATTCSQPPRHPRLRSRNDDKAPRNRMSDSREPVA